MRKLLVALPAIIAAVACGSSTFEGTDASSSNAGSSGTPIAGDAANGSASSSTGNESTGGGGSGGGSGDATATAPKTVTTKETVQAGGKARSFVLVAPKDVAPGKSYPVVFAFHGDGGDGTWLHGAFPLETRSGDSAILVYPDGRDQSWDLYTPEAANEDYAFLDAMVAALKARFSIDDARIFGSGYSSGAFFINQVACRRTGFFRAIAPNAGGAPQEPQDPAATYWSGSYVKCPNQTGGVAALVMHGDQDFVVGQTSGSYDAKYWATVNGCDATEDARVPTTPAPCVEHASCPSGKRVVYCEIAGLGHVIWDQSLQATWSFFMAQ